MQLFPQFYTHFDRKLKSHLLRHSFSLLCTVNLFSVLNSMTAEPHQHWSEDFQICFAPKQTIILLVFLIVTKKICGLGHKNTQLERGSAQTNAAFTELKHFLRSLTSTVNVDSFSASAAGAGVFSSLDTSSIRGATVDVSSLLSTGCPIGANITILTQSSPESQLAFPPSMLAGAQSMD